MNPEFLSVMSELRDVHQPELGGLTIAPLDFLFALLLCTLIALLVWWFNKRRRAHQRSLWQRQANSELLDIRTRLAERRMSETVAACSRLLRRVTLAVEPRSNIASLTGDAWLHKLDGLHGSDSFTHSASKVPALLQLAYKRPHESTDVAAVSPARHDIDQLIELTGELIEKVSASTLQVDGHSS